MRLLLFIFTFLFSTLVMAVDARVLIDEKSDEQILTGQFKVQCLKKQVWGPCSKSYYKFPESQWKLKRTSRGLSIQSLKTKKKFPLRGKDFFLVGKFLYQKREISKLHIKFEEGGTHWVIYLPVDQYLYGVMASEVPVSWPRETLKAQAIASRTYFLFKKQERENEIFDVRATVMDQVFKLDADRYRSVVEAVDDTHGMILVTKEKENIFPAYFHSDCGGHTSNEHNVWRKPAALNKEVQDPYCASASKNNWSHVVERKTMMGLLHKAFSLPYGVGLKYILPRISGENRAHFVDFIFSNNSFKRLSANELRKLLGFGKLKSTQFSVEKRWNEFVFKGRGFGHGVGMCQWGAQRWARKGKDFKQILNHYYPTAQLKNVTDLRAIKIQAHLNH